MLTLVGAVVVVAATQVDSGQSGFDQRRERTDTVLAAAASIERTDAGEWPTGWAREETQADRASTTVISHFLGEQGTSETPLLTYHFDEGSVHVRTNHFDPAADEPTWYLMEDKPGMDPEAFEAQFQPFWGLLDTYTDDTPKRVGPDVVDNEHLERFDLFVPGSMYEGSSITIGPLGMIDPSNGVDYSFWFTDDGELRRMLLSAETDAGTWTFETSLYASNEPVDIESPVRVRSWNELTETLDD